MMKAFRVLMIVVLLIALLPAFSMLASSIIGWVYGCDVDLTSAKTCMINGVDWGRDLLTMGMMGYYLFVTMPVIVGGVAIWIIVELIRWLNARRA